MKILSFEKALNKLKKKGGYIQSLVEKENQVILYLSMTGILMSGKKGLDGEIKHGGSAKFNISFLEDTWIHWKQKTDYLSSLPEKMPIPNNVRDLTPIFNSELNNICGVSYKKVVKELERLSKQKGSIAKIYLMILQSSMFSQVASEKTGSEKKRVYKEKEKHVKKLVELCKKYNNTTVGYTNTNKLPHPVLFFKIPYCEQITICSNINGLDIDPWKGEDWDGKRASTLPKIERAIYESGLSKSMNLD